MRIPHLAPLCAAVLAACTQQQPAEHDERVPFIAKDDVDFIDAMVPHHTGAMEMAERALAAGAEQPVKDFAGRIRDAQAAEIQQLKTIRVELTGSDAVPPMDDEHMQREMEEMMMMSGAELDRMFLESMLPHHAGAIQMADRALPNLQRDDLKAIAAKIIGDQAKEIAEINGLLAP